MNGKEEYFTLIVCSEGGLPSYFQTKTDEDLIDKYMNNRESKYSYFRWNNGCVPMRNLIGVAKNN